MSLLNAADVDELLTSLGNGENAILAGVSAPCIVAPADVEQLGDASAGTPVEVLTRALAVTVRTGVLTALAVGATVTLRGASYRVDRLVRMRNDSLTQFLAYPS